MHKKRAFVIEVETEKEVDHLKDHIANRAYTIDGVVGVSAFEVFRVDDDSKAEDATFMERLEAAIDGLIRGWSRGR